MRGVSGATRRDLVKAQQESARQSMPRSDPRSVAPDGRPWNDLTAIREEYGELPQQESRQGWQVSFKPSRDLQTIHIPAPSNELPRYDALGRSRARYRDRTRNGIRG
jgi:hypothetical protein